MSVGIVGSAKDIQSVWVNVGRGYDVKIGNRLLKDCGYYIAERLGARMACVVTDSNVAPLYLQTCLDSLTQAGFRCALITIPAGESSKNIDSLSLLLETFAREDMSRTDIVVALGGGVIGDLAGFAAACYMRGVSFVQMPTTLLAAVDSSVGGKTAINLTAGKNLAGAFYQPVLVLCDVNCLATLPEREYLCGAAEAIKTGILGDERLFQIFENGSSQDNLSEILFRCVTYKAGVVERDEREQGERKLLNLGHTVGHAIERLSDFTMPHGLAVAAGISVITRASLKRKWCAGETAQRILNTLCKNKLPTKTEYGATDLARAALADKKRDGDFITLITPSEIGTCELRRVNVGELADIIADGLAPLESEVQK